MKLDDRRTTVSWALYDWANSAFATTVMAGFFPLFFKQYWSVDVNVNASTARIRPEPERASLRDTSSLVYQAVRKQVINHQRRRRDTGRHVPGARSGNHAART